MNKLVRMIIVVDRTTERADVCIVTITKSYCSIWYNDNNNNNINNNNDN